MSATPEPYTTTAQQPTDQQPTAQDPTNQDPTAARSGPRRSVRRTAAAVLVALTAASGLTALSAAPAHAICADPPCTGVPKPPPTTPPPPRPHRPGNVPALVVTMGDSYASGQGAPDVNANLPWSGATWQDANCHRSANAAPTEAVSQLRANNPYVEGIDYVSTACSGAQIVSGGILAPQTGANQSTAQVTQVNAAVGSRPIDALVIGIGGNDVHFADIVTACITPWNSCSTGSTAAQFQSDLSTLASHYNLLINSVQGGGKLLNSTVKDVWMTQYPNPVTNSDGSWCNNSLFPDPIYNLTGADSAWAAQTVLAGVNSQIQAAVARANAAPGTHPTWHVVPQANFAGHGVCASSRWINDVGDSIGVQGDVTGTMHPNAAGQWQAAQPIYGALSYLDR